VVYRVQGNPEEKMGGNNKARENTTGVHIIAF
jgi:hypothetical protein